MDKNIKYRPSISGRTNQSDTSFTAFYRMLKILTQDWYSWLLLHTDKMNTNVREWASAEEIILITRRGLFSVRSVLENPEIAKKFFYLLDEFYVHRPIVHCK